MGAGTHGHVCRDREETEGIRRVADPGSSSLCPRNRRHGMSSVAAAETALLNIKHHEDKNRSMPANFANPGHIMCLQRASPRPNIAL